ncbi:MAG: ribosomal-processing cysteine protease Prp [Clostridia bacterium]|nr:ribosomal-processing cysteine protease Prp [Clostridia bacterium]
MIKAELFIDRKGRLSGFHISGHSGTAEAGYDVLCAFVLSAAYMAANTITEVIRARADAEADDGDMLVAVAEKDIEDCQVILAGLRLHLEETEKQYPDNLKVIYTEV